MEQHQDTLAMLELVTRPAFCVKDGVIVQANNAAGRMSIEKAPQFCRSLPPVRPNMRIFPMAVFI